MMEIIAFIQKNWSIIATLFGVIGTLFWLKMDSKYAKKIGCLRLAREHRKKR